MTFPIQGREVRGGVHPGGLLSTGLKDCQALMITFPSRTNFEFLVNPMSLDCEKKHRSTQKAGLVLSVELQQ